MPEMLPQDVRPLQASIIRIVPHLTVTLTVTLTDACSVAGDRDRCKNGQAEN